MMYLSYFDSVADGIEFLLALGSIIGLLGLIMGLIFFIFGSGKYRGKMLGVIIFSIILLMQNPKKSIIFGGEDIELNSN